jgi:FdhD protein
MRMTVELDVIKLNLSTGKTEKIRDCVADEKLLHLFLNRTHVASVMCSHTNLLEFAIGHLLSEDIVKKTGEIEKVILDEDRGICRVLGSREVNWENRLRFLRNRARLILSSCGEVSSNYRRRRFAKANSNAKIKASVVVDCANRLNSLAEVYRRTGGTHAAAIFKMDGTEVSFAEDVGRHNAVDKVIGFTSMKKADFGDCFLMSTGRLTGETVSKAAAMGLPLVASLAAPVSSGISVALDAQLTLVGFVRGRRMNIYTFPERILS